jgi:hypothetical protein
MRAIICAAMLALATTAAEAVEFFAQPDDLGPISASELHKRVADRALHQTIVGAGAVVVFIVALSIALTLWRQRKQISESIDNVMIGAAANILKGYRRFRRRVEDRAAE